MGVRCRRAHSGDDDWPDEIVVLAGFGDRLQLLDGERLAIDRLTRLRDQTMKRITSVVEMRMEMLERSAK